MSAASVALLAACGGLQTAPPTVQQVDDESRVRVVADWDDLWAAGMGGGSPYGWVVLSEVERTPTRVRYSLLSVRDEPGWLLAERATPADEFETEPVEITLTVQLRRFGDSDLEAAVVNAIAHRLRELVGDTTSTLPFREFSVSRPSDGVD